MIGARPVVEPEDRHRLCWYGRRTDRIPPDPGIHTIVDGQLLYCAHPLFFPIIGYEFDIRNCEGCDVFRPKRPATSGPY
jgi:hypothetical protein